MRYAVVTFGCRVNQADSFGLERQLRAAGGRAAPAEAADLVVVNSCSVTASADQGTRQAIRRVARLNPGARIVATGCYATRDAAAVAALPGVVAVVPNDDKEALAERLLTLARADGRAGTPREREAPGPTTAERFGDGDGACGAPLPPGAAGRTTYTLRVQTGCDEVCSYCIIPSTRGRGRSVPLARVLDELDRAAEAGYREAALTGVHLGSYGRDLAPRASLLDLLRALDRHPSTVVVRLSSLEPMDCTPAIVDLVAASPRFAPHFHLPLQHASDAVLRAMRRPYTLDDYRRIVSGIRARMPHAAIGSDLIVGFPGETDGDFEATLAYLARSPLTGLHVFPYSDRPGTAASRLGGKVDGARVRERARAVREAGAALAGRFRRAQVGTLRTSMEHYIARAGGGAVALTDNYLKVRIPAGHPENARVTVRITKAGDTVDGLVVTAGGPPSAAPPTAGPPRG
ncbi:MAG: tRNA (N(6)-L-threonylcarbamoyladenosine(37)-C(2))-methylthiotransferase MtaB [Acidobacteria bacterium]|nr:tRNA (N(6)-L-threonylcarbamoyladenosine(37)-C(2))-methylthiotransferase MtaB [Acidobacteriota bacterium]